MLELRADTGAVWDERHSLLEEIRAFAAQARTLADEAVGRLPDVAASDVSEAREIGVGQEGPLDQDSTAANGEDSVVADDH